MLGKRQAKPVKKSACLFDLPIAIKVISYSFPFGKDTVPVKKNSFFRDTRPQQAVKSGRNEGKHLPGFKRKRYLVDLKNPKHINILCKEITSTGLRSR